MTRSSWPVAVLLALTVALTVGVTSATAANGGNSANAKLCQKDGWMNLQGFSDGTVFRNTGGCVSYAAHGGMLLPLDASVSVTYTPTFDPNYCNVIVGLTNFMPNTNYSVNALVQDFGITSYGPFSVTTDSSGAGSVDIFSYVQSSVSASGYTAVDASVGSVDSGYQTVGC